MFDWLKAKDVLTEARNECKKMRATIERNKLRIEELHKLPRPKDELIELACSWIDNFGSDYPQLLQIELDKYVKNPMTTPGEYHQGKHMNLNETAINPLRIVQPAGPGVLVTTPKTIERALFYIIGDQLKEAVGRVVRDMEYPAIVGPAMPKRLAEIDKLTKENEGLENKVKEIEGGLQESADVCTPAKDPVQKHRSRGEIEYTNHYNN
ncbi:hypothetical protein SAMN05216386_1649 [Nitrosospira briensis]|uniref:Uncharacterized protein n=1 Tax=Nitrosospira briensis TaxID=35799 RepID=A0A1I5B3J1_9PROT|nr:hypothetical protein [Nitrosospira briensis]SFN69265.1 hypothetical protein SAMN05216386_1649 [Nitrosospira briensis]